MAIDWFTLVAQVVNFLVLVGLLKHFLYDRIIGAMNEREATIVGRLQDAAREREAAAAEAALFMSRNREFKEQREQLLAEAGDEAGFLRQQLMEQARLDAEKAQAQWLVSLQRERQDLLQDLRERLGQSVFSLASQALRELAEASLEGQVLKVFVEQVRTLDAAERETIVAAVRDSSRAVEIRTAFPLQAQAQEDLSRALRQYLDGGIELRFTTVPELICGIELRAHSYRLAWNLNAYLEGLEAQVFAALDESARNDAAAR